MYRGSPVPHNGGMTRPATALCSAIEMPAGDVPEWLHLLPIAEARTVDGRGPYRITDAAALMSASLPEGGKLVLCENHATDLEAPHGRPAPARGWIVALQSRADGIWGRVEWTGTGRQMMEDRQYRGVSPVIRHTADGIVTGILRATLTNTPNLTGLVSMHHQENGMDLRQTLVELLKLAGDADDAAILAALRAKIDGGGDAATVALQSALKPIALAAGLAETADAAAVLAGVQQLVGGNKDVVALQSEIVGLTGKITALETEGKRKDATAVIDAAIVAGRVGLKPVRDDYIALQMSDPARAGKLIAAMPIIAPGQRLTGDAPEGTETNPALLASKGAAYQKKLADEGQQISFAAAVRAVSEGKDK